MKKLNRFKSFPHIEQIGMMDCGTTCLAIIFKYYGFYNVNKVLSEIAEVDTEGTNLYVISEIAENFGFKTEAYELEFKYLLEIPLPCIAHFDGYHFIVIYKVNKKYVWVSDPAYGKDRYTKEEFIKRWNGIVLTLETTEITFKDKDLLDLVEESKIKTKSIYRDFYKPVIVSRIKLIFQILFISFLLQLLALSIPIFTQAIVDQVLIYENKRLLISILLGMSIIFSLQIGFIYIRNILLVQFKVLIEHDFFSNYFIHFISLFQSYYDKHKREDFINRFGENIKVREIISPDFLQSFIDLLFILCYIPLLFFYNRKLGLIALLLTFFFIFITILFTPKIRRQANKVFYKDIEVLGKFLDILLGVNTVKLLGIEKIKFFNWKSNYKRSLNTVINSEKIKINLITIQKGIYYFSQLTILWIGAYLVFINELSLGQYLAFITIFMIILNALSNISTLWVELLNISISIERLNDILTQKSEYDDSAKKISIKESLKSLEFRNVSFKYNSNDEKDIIKDFNLKIRPKEKIGLVGRNGSGKSTLTKLMINLYPNYSGDIIINDYLNIQSIDIKSLRKKIFVFPQTPYVFDGTIMENIRYANPEATDDEIVIASKKADLHDFIKKLHLGYNHKVGELGSNLSGGQILKICFARLFVSKTPEILILDEASSALDVESEKKILDNIMKSFRDKIVISIAHRISTLKNSDRILVINDGSIIEEGKHDELIKLKGLYHKFINTYV